MTELTVDSLIDDGMSTGELIVAFTFTRNCLFASNGASVPSIPERVSSRAPRILFFFAHGSVANDA